MVELPQTDPFRTRLAGRLDSCAEEMIDAISSAMFADLGPYQQLAGPGEVDRLRADIRGMLLAFRRLVSGDEAFTAGDLAELHQTGGRRARQGIPLDAVTESIEIAMRVTWRFVRDAAQLVTADGVDGADAAASVADLALGTRDYMNEITAAVVSGYRAEREHGESGRAQATADLVDEVLEARGGNSRRIRQAGRSLGHEITEPLVVALIAGTDPTEPPDPEAVACDLLPSLPLALSSRLRMSPCPHLAVVVPHADGVDPESVRATLTASPLARHTVVIVDEHTCTLDDIHHAYTALTDELATARVMTNGPGVVSPRDTDLLRLLRGLPLPNRLDFVRRVLGPILDLAPAKAAEVLNTLHAYFRGRGRLDETAADLQLHRNSFRYRLDRAQSVLGVSFRDGADRLKVEVALVLHELSRQEAALLDEPVD